MSYEFWEFVFSVGKDKQIPRNAKVPEKKKQAVSEAAGQLSERCRSTAGQLSGRGFEGEAPDDPQKNPGRGLDGTRVETQAANRNGDHPAEDRERAAAADGRKEPPRKSRSGRWREKAAPKEPKRRMTGKSRPPGTGKEPQRRRVLSPAGAKLRSRIPKKNPGLRAGQLKTPER